MNFLIFIILVAGASFYASSMIKPGDNNLISFYVTWAVILISLNLIVTLFIYLFSHGIKNSEGNKGVRGKRGRRGKEGKSDFCNLCPS
jgi:hypothetical protein